MLVLLAGCAPASREELEREVLKADPDFTATLEEHRDLANKIETYEQELALKRTTVERTVTQMRKDLAAATMGVKGRIEETKSRMRPEQDRLKLQLSLAADQLKAKQVERAKLGRAIAKLRKSSSDAGAAGTQDSQQRMTHEQEISDLLSEAARLDQEIGALKEHVRLLKMKLILLRL